MENITRYALHKFPHVMYGVRRFPVADRRNEHHQKRFRMVICPAIQFDNVRRLLPVV
jgi:hypothetical protein